MYTSDRDKRDKSSEKSELLQVALTKLETKPARSTAHMRRLRERTRRGRCLLRVEVDEAALILRLIDVGLLDAKEADDRGALTKATEKALQRMCDGSRDHAEIRNTIAVELVLKALRKKTRETQQRTTRAQRNR